MTRLFACTGFTVSLGLLACAPSKWPGPTPRPLDPRAEACQPLSRIADAWPLVTLTQAPGFSIHLPPSFEQIATDTYAGPADDYGRRATLAVALATTAREKAALGPVTTYVDGVPVTPMEEHSWSPCQIAGHHAFIGASRHESFAAWSFTVTAYIAAPSGALLYLHGMASDTVTQALLLTAVRSRAVRRAT